MHVTLVARELDFGLRQAVAGTEVVVQQLQHPVPRIRTAVVPVDHRHTRELRRETDQLRLAGDVDADAAQLGENVGVDRARQVPVRLRDGRELVPGSPWRRSSAEIEPISLIIVFVSGDSRMRIRSM